MSLELKDFRCKVTPETWAVLKSVAQARRQEMSEVAREILHSWAKDRIHEANILDSSLKFEGLTRIGGDR